MIRPKPVLQQWLSILHDKMEKQEVSYEYYSNQMRAIRQDLTVKLGMRAWRIGAAHSRRFHGGSVWGTRAFCALQRRFEWGLGGRTTWTSSIGAKRSWKTCISADCSRRTKSNSRVISCSTACSASSIWTAMRCCSRWRRSSWAIRAFGWFWACAWRFDAKIPRGSSRCGIGRMFRLNAAILWSSFLGECERRRCRAFFSRRIGGRLRSEGWNRRSRWSCWRVWCIMWRSKKRWKTWSSLESCLRRRWRRKRVKRWALELRRVFEWCRNITGIILKEEPNYCS